MQAGALQELLRECEQEEELRRNSVGDDYEEAYSDECEYEEAITESPIADAMHSKSYISTVSGILLRRHISSSALKQHRRIHQSTCVIDKGSVANTVGRSTERVYIG
ncbi:hypothetical protein COOONC_01074, partial [Cooperia oncophora]